MTAAVLAGRELARSLRARTSAAAATLAATGTTPTLAVVVATDDGASAWYVRSIAKAAAKVGVHGQIVDLGTTADADQIADTLRRLSGDVDVHGVMLQTPLPAGVDHRTLAGEIAVHKDVDGASPYSLGRLVAGLPAFAPATAQAVLSLLDHYDVALHGRQVTVVGRSLVVGKPVAHLLLDRHATVTIAHSRTSELATVTRRADVLVAAVGQPGLIGPAHVRPGAVVIDVGTNATDTGLVGDVDPAVDEIAGALTPVPGGVGPVTTALLLWQTVTAASAPG